MEPIKPESWDEYFQRLEKAAKTLTQEQINACAWAMGGSGVGWTQENIMNSIPNKVFFC